MKESAFSPRRIFVPGGRCAAYARRRADARLVKALDQSVHTSDKALKEVERLKLQRRRLARHCLEFRDRIQVATTIIEAVETGANNALVELVSTKRNVQRLQEENEHLRADSVELMDRLKALSLSSDADTQSVLDANFDLLRSLRHANHEIIRQQDKRRCLIRRLRAARNKAHAWDRLVVFLDSELSSAWYPLNIWAKGLARAYSWARRKLGWIMLAPIFGRRGAGDVQEALYHG